MDSKVTLSGFVGVILAGIIWQVPFVNATVAQLNDLEDCKSQFMAESIDLNKFGTEGFPSCERLELRSKIILAIFTE